MESLPPSLRDYFKSHLKLMATISHAENGIQWALFFGAKGQKPAGDEDFKGTVNNNPALDLTWISGRPLWFMPISEEAKNEVLQSIKENRKPVVKSRNISIHNEGKSVKDWKDYNFWEPEPDLTLILDADALLQALSPKGQWLSLDADNGQPWPVWLTTETIDTEDKLLVFPAPQSHIVDAKGKYINHHFWFGITQSYRLPFFIIDESAQTLNDVLDAPIYWSKKGRVEQALMPDHDAIKAEMWRHSNPFKLPDLNRRSIPVRICNSFARDTTSHLYSWIVKETPSSKQIFVLYTKVYRTSGKLNEYIGGVPLGGIPALRIRGIPNVNNIGLIQVSDGNTTRLLTRVAYFFESMFLKLFNHTTHRISQGLGKTQSASPVGIVPELSGTGDTQYSYVSQWQAGTSSCRSSGDGNQYSLQRSIIFNEGKESEFGFAQAKLPSLQHHRPYAPDQSKKVLFLNKPVFSSAKQSLSNDNGTLYQVILKSYVPVLVNSETGGTVKEDIVLRDGAFAFTLDKKLPEEEILTPLKYGRFRLTLQRAKSQRPFFLWQWFENIDQEENIVVSYSVEDFSLHLSKVEAAGQDAMAKDKFLAPRGLGTVAEGYGERQEPPLVIALKPDEKSATGSYLLTFSESVNVGQNHRLDIRLQELLQESNASTQKTKGTRIKAVILDANPQIAALVDARFLQQPAHDDGSWVLARRSPFSEEEGGWELLDDSASTEGFLLVLPAQAVGEAYVKKDKEGNRPPDEPATIAPGEPEEGKPIDYRFGAPAILRLASERLEKRYVAVPWNLRRIWGQSGEVNPGIPFLETQFELLYGLMGNLRPEKSLIAELASKLGEFPVPPVNSIAWKATSRQQDVFDEAWNLYVQFYRAWKSRLAILEASGEDGSGNSTFGKNIAFNARVKLSESNSDFTKIAGASLRPPFPFEPTSDATDPDTVLKRKIEAVHDKEGLAGGFHYGFESPAIYQELWRELFGKGSSSAEVKDLAFSSLGGWGKQTARFAGDKTVIRSVTSMGRTHFYAVERIGRIGVLWHKAKHVIEYERTVVPPAQFPNQPAHVGRPLVRKVREYVEILEPSRSYPDFSTSVPDAPGAIKSCTFKSTIIPVLSTWGHDVWGKNTNDPARGADPVKATSIGWEVPLWNTGADIRIYPKPQIVLALTPSPEADEESVLVNLSKPENLWFYTDTREFVFNSNKEKIEIISDVHAWPPVKDVDFTDLPEPEQYDIEPSAGNSPELMDAPLPDVQDIPPGFERFTFPVDRSEMPAAIAARYYPESAITGRLRTASMMRSGVTKNSNWWTSPDVRVKKAKDALKALIDGQESLLAASANGFSEIEKKIASRNSVDKSLLSHYKTRIKKDLDKLKLPLKELRNVIPAGGVIEMPPQNLKNVAGKAATLEYQPTKWLWRASVDAAEGMIQKTLTYYTETEKIFLKELERILLLGNSASKEAYNLLSEFKERLIEFHVDIQFKVDSCLGSILKTLDSLTDSISASVDESFTHIHASLDALLDTPVDKLKKEITNRIDSKTKETEDLINSIFKTLSAIPIEEWEKITKPIHAELSRILADYKERMRKAVDTAALEGPALIAYVKQLIAAETTPVKTQIESQLGNVRKSARLLVAVPLNTFDDINKQIHNLGTEIEGLITGELNQLAEAWRKGKTIVTKQVDTALLAIKNKIQARLVTVLEPVLFTKGQTNTVHGALKSLDEVFKAFEDLIKASLINLFGGDNFKADDWLGTLEAYKRLEAAFNGKDKAAILRESVALANSVNQEYGRLAGEVTQTLRDLDRISTSAEQVLQSGQQTLKNFRTVWEEFTAPGMGLNRKTVAMIVNTDWNDVEQRLSITPSITRVKQFGESLEGLGLRLPVAAITERLLPAKEAWGNAKSALNKFDFSNLMSDVGGMRLDKLFPGFKMPGFARDKIKITQGFDKANLMAWANAETDVELGKKQTLMSIGPMKIELDQGHFEGKMRLEFDIDGKTKKTNSGKVSGSWHISVAGTGIMIFRDTSIIFKEDKLTFDLDPRRMEMPGLLKLLTDATTTISDTGMGGTSPDGEKIEVFKVGLVKVKEIPAGVRASLDLPPITVGAGTTAITNLCFGGHFELLALDKDLKFRFLLGLGFYLGKKDAPFNVTVFILGGGGYVDCALSFEPKAGLSVDFVLSVHASVSFAISAGWMTGYVLIMAGFEGEYHKRPNTGASVYITIFVRVIGCVNMLSIATIWLGIYLSATYRTLNNGENELVGAGMVRAQIRICRFLKIKVRKSYTKKFAGSGSGSKSTRESRFADKAIEQEVQNILISLA